jgi:UDP-N-acetylmuramoylalanine--D-glutamate ligase
MSMDNIAILEALKERFDLDTENSKILVVGLGHTGVSVAYYLQKLGFKFAITDSRDKCVF